MSGKLILKLEHPVDPILPCSRLFLFDIAEDGTKSIRDILEASNDYTVVTAFARTLKSLSESYGLLAITHGGKEAVVRNFKTERGFINNLLHQLAL